MKFAVWNFGENKSPGPGGYTFEFFRRYWRFIGSNFCSAVECFFESGSFPKGNLVFDIQSAFVANRQILDGPFILNELLAWCKKKKKQAMIFKVDFAKAATSDGLFKGIQIQGSVAISHLFYYDDAVFIGEWSDSNLENIVKILKCFFLVSGLKINIQKSQVLGVGVPRNIVNQAGSLIGCAVMQNPFRYLGVMVEDSISRKIAWADMVQKLRYRLSKWKVKTLSIGGRLTLLKSVLGASPLYNMSIYKVPKGVLKEMEAIRCNFFNGADPAERKITWVSWDKVLVSKKNAVSEFQVFMR
nr:RNA-directed DNA polymerase, eukaryota [Tanacetum cinerariifolium]